MNAKWMLALMVATASASGVALAAESTDDVTSDAPGAEVRTLPESRATFNTLDQNDDAMISMEEAQEDEGVTTQFDDLDMDDDDMLDEGEFAEFEVEGGAAAEGEAEADY